MRSGKRSRREDEGEKEEKEGTLKLTFLRS